MLQASDLSSGYRPGVPVLRGIELKLEPGEAIGIIGRNGAGKSCLARCLGGLQPVFGGRLSFGDKDLVGTSPRERVSLGMSLVPEGRLVFGQLTVRENLTMAAFGAGRRLAPERLALIEGHFPVLAKKAGAPAASLSGGEQQWLAIGRALVQEPTLIVLDEPSLGLAPIAVKELGEALRGIRDLGVALLLMEQNPELLREVCSQVLVLDQGSVTERLPLDGLHKDADLAALFLGEDGPTGRLEIGVDHRR